MDHDRLKFGCVDTLLIFQELNESLKHSSKHQSWHKVLSENT